MKVAQILKAVDSRMKSIEKKEAAIAKKVKKNKDAKPTDSQTKKLGKYGDEKSVLVALQAATPKNGRNGKNGKAKK